jgi:hypothetical protein
LAMNPSPEYAASIARALGEPCTKNRFAKGAGIAGAGQSLRVNGVA